LARAISIKRHSQEPMMDHRRFMTQHIGIVASTAEGAALCYRTICHEAAVFLGPHAHPEVTMHTFSLDRYVRAIGRADWSAVAALMSQSSVKLAQAGADFIICPNNTLHEAFGSVLSPIPWLHIADIVATEAARRGFRLVGILGTRTVMEGSVYRQKLGQLGIDHAVPDEDDRATLQNVILNELVAGETTKGAQSYLSDVVARLSKQGCDAVILACTELPLLAAGGAFVLPLLNSTQLLARAALLKSLTGQQDTAMQAPVSDEA
jgi:aspartate racemase